MSGVELTKGKSLEFKKHVGLIHSTNKLSLLERKIANALLYQAYENLLTRNEHQIHIPSLCILIGYNSKDHKTIKKALMSLISTVLEWNLIDQLKQGDKGIWMASAMLADAKIEGTICTYSYSNRMRELCYYPEFYGRLNMQVLSLFKSTYGLALYENCIRYQNISQTPWLDLSVYRKLMGVSSDKYVVFRDLNTRVIKPAVNEVNEYSPIRITPEFKKENRVVSAIRFNITKRDDNEISQQIIKNEADRTLIERLREDYGLSALKIKDVFDKYEDSYLLAKMGLIESSVSYKEGKIKNLARYLEKALLEDYQPPKSSKNNLEQLQIKREKEKAIRVQHEKNMEQYRAYQTLELFTIYEALPEKEKSKIIKEFYIKDIAPTMYQSIYTKEGLNSPLVRDRFSAFISKNYPYLLTNLVSFEEFCKTT